MWLTGASEAQPQQERLTEALLACLLQLVHYIGDASHHPARQQRAWHTQQVKHSCFGMPCTSSGSLGLRSLARTQLGLCKGHLHRLPCGVCSNDGRQASALCLSGK